jgi:hypothetical protein
MKNVCMAIGAVALITSQLSAQRDGIRPGGGIARPIGPTLGHPGISNQRFIDSRSRGGFGRGVQWIYPAFFTDNDYQANPMDDYVPQPNVFIVMPAPQAPPEPPPPPPPPPAAVVREYHWPEASVAPAPFSIVSTNGTVYYATMAWTEGGRIHFNSPDGGARQMPLSSVSRALTYEANARKGLTLPLP